MGKDQYSTTKDTKSTKESENETFDAIFQFCHVEIHQQSDLHPRQFHVGQQLSFVNAFDSLDALQFDDELVFDENVNSVSTIDLNVFVLYRQRMLELKRHSLATQLMRQTLFVGRFQQSRPKVPMYFDGTTDDTIRKLIELHLRALRVLRGWLFPMSCAGQSEWRTTN